jgi:hypothetical protein
VNAAQRARFLAILFWNRILGHNQFRVFPTLRGIPQDLPMALVCQYFDNAAIDFSPAFAFCGWN